MAAPLPANVLCCAPLHPRASSGKLCALAPPDPYRWELLPAAFSSFPRKESPVLLLADNAAHQESESFSEVRSAKKPLPPHAPNTRSPHAAPGTPWRTLYRGLFFRWCIYEPVRIALWDSPDRIARQRQECESWLPPNARGVATVFL